MKNLEGKFAVVFGAGGSVGAAVAKEFAAEGAEVFLAERGSTGSDRLLKYPFYSAAIGDLELRRGNHRAAREYFRQARSIARNPMERAFLDQRVSACEHADVP